MRIILGMCCLLASTICVEAAPKSSDCGQPTERPSRSFCGDAATDLLDEDPIRCPDQDILIHAIKAFVPKPDKKDECPKGATDRWDTNLPKWNECFHMNSFEWCQFGSCSPMDILKVFGFRQVRELCEDDSSAQGSTVLVRVQYTCAKVDTILCSATSSPSRLTSSELLRLPRDFHPSDSCSCVLRVPPGVTVSLQTMHSTSADCFDVAVNNKTVSLDAMGTITSCFEEEILAEFHLALCQAKTPDFWLAHSSVTELEMKCSLTMPDQPTSTESSSSTTYFIPVQSRRPTKPDPRTTLKDSGRFKTSTEIGASQATPMPQNGQKQNELDTEFVVGIAVGVILLVILGLAIAVCLVLKRKRRHALTETAKQPREEETYSTLDLPETNHSDYENLDKKSATRRPLPSPGKDRNKYEKTKNELKIGKDNHCFDAAKDENNYEDLKITPSAPELAPNGYVVFNGGEVRYGGGNVEKDRYDDDYENIYDYVHDYDYIKD